VLLLGELYCRDLAGQNPYLSRERIKPEGQSVRCVTSWRLRQVQPVVQVATTGCKPAIITGRR